MECGGEAAALCPRQTVTCGKVPEGTLPLGVLASGMPKTEVFHPRYLTLVAPCSRQYAREALAHLSRLWGEFACKNLP